jgi:hypothetical protein
MKDHPRLKTTKSFCGLENLVLQIRTNWGQVSTGCCPNSYCKEYT